MSQAVDSQPAEKIVSFRAEVELVEALEQSARTNDRSLSAEIRQAVRAYLAAADKEVAA